MFCTAAAHLPHMAACPHGRHTVSRGMYMQTTHLRASSQSRQRRARICGLPYPIDGHTSHNMRIFRPVNNEDGAPLTKRILLNDMEI